MSELRGCESQYRGQFCTKGAGHEGEHVGNPLPGESRRTCWHNLSPRPEQGSDPAQVQPVCGEVRSQMRVHAAHIVGEGVSGSAALFNCESSVGNAVVIALDDLDALCREVATLRAVVEAQLTLDRVVRDRQPDVALVLGLGSYEAKVVRRPRRAKGGAK